MPGPRKASVFPGSRKYTVYFLADETAKRKKHRIYTDGTHFVLVPYHNKDTLGPAAHHDWRPTQHEADTGNYRERCALGISFDCVDAFFVTSKFLGGQAMNLRRNSKAESWYHGADVPMAEIRRFARDVARRFRPEKIILFGSFAYGKPDADSDVDILVVMPARNEIDQAVKIDCVTDPPFALDLIVRTPRNIAWRLEEGDSFLREIMAKGKVLYEKTSGAVGAKGGSRLSARRKTSQRKRVVS